MRKILVGDNKYALCDDEDYDILIKYKWRMWGHYPRTDIGRDFKTMHRLIMNAKKGQIIDHIDRNKLNNQKSNLRFCTRSENSKNRKASGKSKYLGVAIHQTNVKYKQKTTGKVVEYISRPRYISHIKANDKYLHLGLFDCERQAAIAYNNAAIKYHGEFANLNKI